MAKKKRKEEKKGEREEKKPKNQVEDHEKILKNVLVGVAVIVLIILIAVLTIKSLSAFTVQGVNFDVKKFCDSGPCLTTYHTTLPVIYQGKNAKYNFYLRNDPRKLIQDVPFEGSLGLKKQMYLNISYNQVCGGDSQLALQNFRQLQGDIVGASILNGRNETCSSALEKGGNYVLLKESNETSIEQPQEGCYVINVNQCEILEGTERFMVETFIKLNQL